MRFSPFRSLALPLAALLVLPLRSEGGAPEQCANTSTSLASTVQGPEVGDETFFSISSGPANVAFLLDTSGSMMELPQCGDYTWGESSSLSTCKFPTNAATWVNNGTCLGGANDNTNEPKLVWMKSIDITKAPALADPGHGTNSLGLTDTPSWGTGCSGDSCMFSPSSYYMSWNVGGNGYDSWDINHGYQKTACMALDTSGNPAKDSSGNVVYAQDKTACQSCLDNKGFYFFKATYRSGGSNVTGTYLQYSGKWLNANPPKFVSARKVIKDLAWLDPNNQQKLDKVRFGLFTLNASTDPTGAVLVVPLGPEKAKSFYPGGPLQSDFVPARQLLINVLNRTASSGNVSFGGGTPLASALFNVGQYFSSVGYYETQFPQITVVTGQTCTGWGKNRKCTDNTDTRWPCSYSSTYFDCQENAFAETSAGTANASWAGGSGQCSICWGCQLNSVIAVTDGSPNSEITFPTKITTFDDTAYKSTDNCGTHANGSTCGGSNLPRVAAWLHSSGTDLRSDLDIGNPQNLNIYTISFNIPDDSGGSGSQARNILNATANLGGGKYEDATSGSELADALYKAVNDVLERQNSFSAAAVNSLQTSTTAANEAFLTRFKPTQNSVSWEGHVFQGQIFDEFLAGCDPTMAPGTQSKVACASTTVDPNFNGDKDSNGLNICTGVFLVDQDCSEIVEDAKTGDFVKRTTGKPANLAWDAGKVLSDSSQPGYKSADARNIEAVVGGSLVAFTTANAATVSPYMDLDPAWCISTMKRAKLCGVGSAPACPTTGTFSATNTNDCAKMVIQFVRGWDVLDADGDGCAGPNNPNNVASQNVVDSAGAATSVTCGTAGEERNRNNDANLLSGGDASKVAFWKLGDIVHSSPAAVKAPIDEPSCDLGYDKQCLATLHSPPTLSNQTPIDQSYSGCKGTKNVDAYERWRLDQWASSSPPSGAKARKRVVMVGANDGMWHGFDAGDPDSSKTEDAFCERPYTTGDGSELWAIIPPDMLPRLRYLLDGHQYMVDGSTMVRDVWVDGGSSGDPTAKDGKKQKDEYHSMAIVTERSGGRQVHAFDLTDPTNPVYKWSFPPPGSEDSRWMGQSWSDFAPRPAPIGPVRLDPSEERWVVMINGGYDPALSRGRAVWMLDVWTGKVIWRYTDHDFKTQFGYASSTSMFPVPAAVAMMDIGDTTRPAFDNDGFFDTATWGDMGGNVFVARFKEPGKVDSTTKRVGNWLVARAFEEQRPATGNAQAAAGRNEFFYMTANAFDGPTHTLRTFLGTGDRQHIMQQGPDCEADNLLGCCKAGCTTASSSTTDTFGACTMSSSFACSSGSLTLPDPTTTCTDPASCTSYSSSQSVTLTCPGATTTTANAGITCDANGICSALTQVGTQKVTSSTFTKPPRNRFYGFWSYGRDPKKMFDDPNLATAKTLAATFEANRFTDVDGFAGTCSGIEGKSCALVNVSQAKVTYDKDNPTFTTTTCADSSAKCSATANDPGWYYEYGNLCPLSSCTPDAPWEDEKTGTGGTVVQACTVWTGFRPIGGTSASSDPCTGSVGAPVTYGYTGDFISGVPSPTCGYADDGKVYRAAQRNTIAPPTAATTRVTVNANGQINYSTLTMDPGSPPSSKSVGTRQSFVEPVYWLEVPRQLHQCRHVDSASCP